MPTLADLQALRGDAGQIDSAPSDSSTAKPTLADLQALREKNAPDKNVGDVQKTTQVSDQLKTPETKEKILAQGGYDQDVDYGFGKEGVPSSRLGTEGYVPKGTHWDTMLKPRSDAPQSLSEAWKGFKKLPAQIELQRADNPQQAKAALERMYGKGNVGQDKGGRWWANIDGKKEAIFAGGQGLTTDIEKFATGTESQALPLAGSAAAEGLVGVPLSPFTAGLSMPLAWFGGGALGKGLDTVLKHIEGTDSNTRSEDIGESTRTGVENALAFGLPAAVKKTVTGVANIVPKYMAKTTDLGRSMTNELLELGYRPPLASVAPGMMAGKYETLLRNAISGDPKTAINVAGLKHEMTEVLKTSGLSDEESHAMLKKITAKSEALSTREIGEALTKRAKAIETELKASADVSLKNAQYVADSQVSLFKKLASTAEPIGKDVAASIVKNRQDMSAAYGAAYKHLEVMTNGEAVVPLYPVKNAVFDIVKDLSPDKVPTIFSNILKMDQADVTVMKMHEIRSAMRDAEMASNLTPTPENFRFGEVADRADAAFKMAEKNLKGSPYENAIPYMRQVDKGYAQAIAPYKDAVINKLVSGMKAGIQPNPEVTAKLIAQEGYTERTKVLMDMMSPETRRKVTSAFTKSIFEDAQKLSGTNEFMTSGRALLKTLDDPTYRQTLDAIYEPVYGKEFTTKLRAAVRDLAEMDGKLDLESIEKKLSSMQPGAMFDALTEYTDKLRAVDAFVKNNPLGSLKDGNPMVVDRALRTIVQPGNEATLALAAHTLNPEGPEWKMIQDWANKDLLSKAIHRSTSGADLITGKSLKEALSGYTEAQQKLLFPDEIMEKLKKLADHADFLFPFEHQDFGGALAAAGIKGKVPFSRHADVLYVWHKFLGWALEHPSTLKYIANGLDNPSLAERAKARTMMEELFKYVSVEREAGPGDKKAR